MISKIDFNDGVTSYSDLIKNYSDSGLSPDGNKYIQTVSEALGKGECPLVVRQLIEAQHNYSKDNGQPVRTKLFFSGGIGALASVTAKTVGAINSVLCLPLCCCYSLGRESIYTLDGEVGNMLKTRGECWIDFGVSLITVPVTWVAFFYPPLLSGTYKSLQDYYVNRLDRDEKRKYLVDEKIKMYEFRQKDLIEKWDQDYKETIIKIESEEAKNGLSRRKKLDQCKQNLADESKETQKIINPNSSNEKSTEKLTTQITKNEVIEEIK